MGMTTVMTAGSDRRRQGPSGAAQGVDRALRSVVLTGVCLTAFAWLTEGTRAGLGVACGAVLAAANLWAFARVISAFLEQRGRTVPWIVVSLVKVLALFAVAYELMKHGLASPLALAVGYASLPVGIVVVELFGRGRLPAPDSGAASANHGSDGLTHHHDSPESTQPAQLSDSADSSDSSPDSLTSHDPLESFEHKDSGSSRSVT